MTLDEYQNFAWAIFIMKERSRTEQLSYATMKLCGEAGEVAEKMGKALRDGGSYPQGKQNTLPIALECGDVLWYLAIIARIMGYSLSELITLNHEKLSGRVARGTLGGSGDDR